MILTRETTIVPVVKDPYRVEIRAAIADLIRECAPTELTFRVNKYYDYATVVGYVKGIDQPCVVREVLYEGAVWRDGPPDIW